MSQTRICVVTGGNKGIGLSVVKELCSKFDGIVYLTARDEGRGLAAVQELKKTGLSPRFHQLDIDNQESIDKFAKYIKDTYSGLDVLVNNAAIAYKNEDTTPFGEQAEVTLRVNYFGTLAVCHALFPLLRPHARVVNVSSLVGHLSWVKGDEPNCSALKQRLASESLTEEELNGIVKEFIGHAKAGTHKAAGWQNSTYSVSKVALCAATRIQQRAFDADSRADLVVNSCHPGWIDTDMSSHQGPMTVDEGAVCPTYLALLPPDITEPKGAYLWSGKEVIDWVNGPCPSLIGLGVSYIKVSLIKYLKKLFLPGVAIVAGIAIYQTLKKAN